MINQYAKDVHVEVVTAKTSEQLRKLVNESLANNPFFTVQDIRFTTHGGSVGHCEDMDYYCEYSAMIIYLDK